MFAHSNPFTLWSPMTIFTRLLDFVEMMIFKKVLGFRTEPSTQPLPVKSDASIKSGIPTRPATPINSDEEQFHIIKLEDEYSENNTNVTTASTLPAIPDRQQDHNNPQHPLPELTATLPLTAARDATPWPNKTFIITPLNTTDNTNSPSIANPTRALALADGVLRLVTFTPSSNGTPHQGSSLYWRCVENRSGWLGFRNTASGTYLGHDCFGNVRATAPHHLGWEFVVPRRQPGGGYVMALVALTGEDRNRDGYGRLMKIGQVEGKGEDGQGAGTLVLLGEDGGEGLVWEFLEVAC